MIDYRDRIKCDPKDPCDYDNTCINHKALAKIVADHLAALKEKEEIIVCYEVIKEGVTERVTDLESKLKEKDAEVDAANVALHAEWEEAERLTKVNERLSDAIKEKDEESDYFRHELNERTRQLSDAKAEVEQLHTMSTVEMMCENINVRYHIEEWETRCLKAEAEVERLKEEGKDG